jgi:hypothetical protein
VRRSSASPRPRRSNTTGSTTAHRGLAQWANERMELSLAACRIRRGQRSLLGNRRALARDGRPRHASWPSSAAPRSWPSTAPAAAFQASPPGKQTSRHAGPGPEARCRIRPISSGRGPPVRPQIPSARWTLPDASPQFPHTPGPPSYRRLAGQSGSVTDAFAAPSAWPLLSDSSSGCARWQPPFVAARHGNGQRRVDRPRRCFTRRSSRARRSRARSPNSSSTHEFNELSGIH